MILSEVKKYLRSLKTAEGTVDDSLIETENSAMLAVTWSDIHKTLRIIDDSNGYFIIEIMDAIVGKDGKEIDNEKLLSAAAFYGISVEKRTVQNATYGVLFTRIRPKNVNELSNDILNFAADCSSYIERYNNGL